MDGFFDVFQLAALGVFLVLFIGRTMTMRLREGVNPITLAAGKTGVRMVAEAFLPFGLLAWAAVLVLASFDVDLGTVLGEQVIDSAVARAAGAAGIVSGIVMFAWALASFGSSWRVGIDEGRPGGLVTGGVFRLTRNPIFLFLDAYFVGAFLINGTVFFLAAALLAVGMTHFQILQEERFLAGRYGSEYLEYKRRTPRYLPNPFGPGETRTEEGAST